MTYPYSDCCPNTPEADPGCDDGWCCTHETTHEETEPMTQPADDVDRAVAEASRRIGQLATGAFDIPDVREAARQAGFGEAPETITVTGVWLCTFTWEDRDGEHRCDDFREHVEHHCCCGATMQPAKKLTKKKGRRSR